MNELTPREEVKTTKKFDELGLAPLYLDILTSLKFTQPTPIQEQAIPTAVQGQDIIGIAQTGTGKTLAFGLPMIQRLSQGPGRGLVILPTRELAYQVEESLQKFAPKAGIGIAVFIGGASMHQQRMMLKRNPRILIATPGRLLDHLQQRTITLKEVSILVLDEADRMLDMGFAPQINKILAHVPKKRQTMLFSATMPREILALAESQMSLPIRIEVAPAGTTASTVEQEVFIVKKEDKITLLRQILSEYKGSVLVFSRTKHGAKKLTRAVSDMHHRAAEIHANRTLAQRREALEGFKRGKYRVLIATDIAARGIDVTGIELVVNYDLPDNPEDYVHRIGRTGRAGKLGKALSFAHPDQSGDIKTIERLIRGTLPRVTREGITAVEHVALRSTPSYRHKRSGFGARRGSGRRRR